MVHEASGFLHLFLHLVMQIGIKRDEKTGVRTVS